MGHGPKQTALEKETIDRRREAVANLRIRRLSIREIAETLPKLKIVSPDGSPWSRATIGGDLVAIREEWKERASESFDAHVAEMMAALDQIDAEAWRQGNLDALLRSQDRRSKLLGLDRPQRREISGPNGSAIPLLNVSEEKSAEVLARLGYGDSEDTEDEPEAES